jgi:hypothetical protein
MLLLSAVTVGLTVASVCCTITSSNSSDVAVITVTVRSSRCSSSVRSPHGVPYCSELFEQGVVTVMCETVKSETVESVNADQIGNVLWAACCT